MARDWKRLGGAVKAARHSRGMTQAQLADALRIETSTLQNLESARYGRGWSRIPRSARQVAEFFQWPQGVLEDLLNGEDPDLSPPQAPAKEGRGNVLPLRIADELADEGELIDATVLDLSPAGSNARMIVVVKGQPDASPEEIRQALLEWRRTQRRLKGLDDDTPDGPSVANGA